MFSPTCASGAKREAAPSDTTAPGTTHGVHGLRLHIMVLEVEEADGGARVIECVDVVLLARDDCFVVDDAER